MKQTSIEWLIEQFPDDYLRAMPHELIEQAKEMHKQEMAINRSELKISDEEIEKAADKYCWNESRFTIDFFVEGAKWYREQLKNK